MYARMHAKTLFVFGIQIWELTVGTRRSKDRPGTDIVKAWWAKCGAIGPADGWQGRMVNPQKWSGNLWILLALNIGSYQFNSAFCWSLIS